MNLAASMIRELSEIPNCYSASLIVGQAQESVFNNLRDFWIYVKVEVLFEEGNDLKDILKLHLKPPMKRPILIPLIISTLVVMLTLLILAIVIIAQQHYYNS